MNDTHTFAVYERRIAADQAAFQIVKYDDQGVAVDELTWPGLYPSLEFIPRAMKVVYEENDITRVYIAGDGPDSSGDRRIMYVVSLDENLDEQWAYWTPTPGSPHPRDEKAVALDAGYSYVAVVGHNYETDNHYWATVVLSAATGLPAEPVFYYDHTNPGGPYHQPEDAPVDISLYHADDLVEVAVVGELTSGTWPESFAQCLIYRLNSPLHPNPLLIATGVGGVGGYPDHNSYPSAVKIFGGRLYVTGYGRFTWPVMETDFDQFFSIIDVYHQDQVSWTNVYGGSAQMHDKGLDLDVRGFVSEDNPPATSFMAAPAPSAPVFLGARAWTTGYTTDSTGEQRALTIQYNDEGTQWDATNERWYIKASVEWRSIWNGGLGVERPFIGMFVQAREKYNLGDQGEAVYVAGVAENPTTNVLETFLMKFTGEIPTNPNGKVPYWDEIRISHGGGDDVPASLQEREILNVPRRVTIGVSSGHSVTDDDNLTVYYEYDP